MIDKLLWFLHVSLEIKHLYFVDKFQSFKNNNLAVKKLDEWHYVSIIEFLQPGF